MKQSQRELSAAEFLSAIQQGGQVLELAVARLYRSEYARLVRLATKKTWDKTQAEQIVQEAFMKLLAHRDQYRGEVAPAGYVTGIVRNLTFDHVRRQINTRESSWDGDEDDEANDPKDTYMDKDALTPDDAVFSSQLADCIQRHLLRLNGGGADFMQVFSLVFEQELKPAELAQVLGRSPGATRQLIYACRQKLRDLLKPCYGMLGDAEMEAFGHG